MIHSSRMAVESIKNKWDNIKLVVENTTREFALPVDEYTRALDPEKSATFMMGLYEDGIIIGLILYKFTGVDVDLREILVLDKYQKKGIGKHFLNTFINDIRETMFKNQENSCCRYITIQVNSDKINLISFYKNAGFVKITSRYPHPSLVKHDVMELDLYTTK